MIVTEKTEFYSNQYKNFRGGFGRDARPPYFWHSLIFCNHFEELRTVLFDVELIINNAPLTYVCPNTIKTCLTPNHLLFGRQFLYSSNKTSTVVTNLNCLSNTTDKINGISNHFQDKWRHEYVVNLRETQRTSKLNINSPKINVNDIVLVYDSLVKRCPDIFGELPK